MSVTVNVSSPQDMYRSFFEIYPEFRVQCSGFRTYNWGDSVRKILININNIEVKILFGVRKDDEGEAWTQFSALLVPSPKNDRPDPDKNAEVEFDEEDL